MRYPEYMTKEEIAEFEREYEQWLKEEQAYHDEPYEPVTGCDPEEYNDNWYDDQYEVDTDYL